MAERKLLYQDIHDSSVRHLPEWRIAAQTYKDVLVVGILP